MIEFDILSTGLKTAAMLFIVIGLLVLVLHFIKRFLVARRGEEGDLLIRVLATHHLSPKERIEIIEVSGERMVLGVTPGHINFLSKLDGLGKIPSPKPEQEALPRGEGE